MIGDGQTAALVGKNGSIDWLCWPTFDSDACFASLLGGQSNGFWLITPNEEIKSVSRRYRPDTLILETTFVTVGGQVTLIDFMPPNGSVSHLIRIARCDEGEVPMCMELMLRFGYGATTPWVTRLDDGTMRAVAGPDMVTLRTLAPFRGENFKTVAMFTLAKGRSVPFVLSYGPSHLELPSPVDAHEALEHCETFWRDWTATTKAEGPYKEAIVRSLITLKGLVYRPTGGIVAAPTTSLPEHFGSERNWDYRLCWLRDSTLTLLAMMNAGIYDEAAAWRDWLQRAVAGSPGEMQIMYGLRGERRLTEWEVDWLPGYADSRPVRIGNAAHEQFQLDVYGELMDSFEQARKGGIASTDGGWEMQLILLGHVADIWNKPDSGIWESRGPTRHYVYSKAMAWVCFDRGIKAVENHGLKGPVDEWRRIRDEIHAVICAQGFDAGAQHVQGRLRRHRPRREPAAPCPDRLHCGRRSAFRRHRRGDREGAAARGLRDALQHAPHRRRPQGRAKARSSPAASGCATPSSRSAATTTRRSCSSACSRSATIWACWPKSTSRARSATRATSRRPSPTSA